MKFPEKIIFPKHEDYESLQQTEKASIKADHRDKLLYITRLIEEETPNITPRKAKANGLTQFMRSAGLGLICIESQDGNKMGWGIYDPVSLKELCFIGCRDNFMNKFHNFYYSGIFDSHITQ